MCGGGGGMSEVCVVFSPSVASACWSVGRGGRLRCWWFGGGGGFAPLRWLAPAVFPLPAARWVAPLAGGVPSVAYVGFSSSSLARLLAARLPLAFPRGLFLSLCSFLIIP